MKTSVKNSLLNYSLSLAVFALINALVSTQNVVAHEGHERDNTTLFPPKQPNRLLATAPEKAELVAPEAFAKISGAQVTLKWKAAFAAEFYHLQVATDPNFKWLKVDEPFLSTTSFDLKGLEAGKHYYWRVASVLTSNIPGSTKSAFARSMFATGN